MNESEKTKEEIGKKNYCDKDGNCTVEDCSDELNCTFCDIGFLRGTCTYLVYFADRCLSPKALVAARAAVA